MMRPIRNRANSRQGIVKGFAVFFASFSITYSLAVVTTPASDSSAAQFSNATQSESMLAMYSNGDKENISVDTNMKSGYTLVENEYSDSSIVMLSAISNNIPEEEL